MVISIGSDHGGYDLKESIKTHLNSKGITVLDFGTKDKSPCDYPDIAKVVAKSIVTKEADFGVLICGTGIGISIAANKVKGIRASLVHDVFSAKATREHNDANILCMGARVIGEGLALEILDNFLKTEFSKDKRHIDRINKIED
ncbi:MAG: ribose 5-phosphate isomerase B [Lachnospirales bacterium]